MDVDERRVLISARLPLVTTMWVTPEFDDMQMAPANPLVGNVRNNGPEMLNSA